MDNNADFSSNPPSSRARATRVRGAERRVATILFADIVNSSNIFLDRELEDASQRLQQLIDILSACVRVYNGTVAQEMGDGIMCLFGAPLAEEQHALRACLAARDMVRAAQDNALSGGDDLQIRIGVATGEVLMRPVEDGLRQDFRILGETVHRAAKLQQQAEPDTILIADTTYKLTKTQIVCEALPAQPKAFHLVSVTSGGQSALDLMATPIAGQMFGRAEELARLKALARSTTRDQGRSVLITGDPGIGKSRLVSEFIHSPELADWSVIHWPQAAIRSVDARQPLEELADRLARSAGHSSAVCDAAEIAAGTLARAAMEECYGLPVTDPRWHGLDPAQRRPFLFEGLVAVIGEFSRSRSLVLVVEDAHWAGTDTLRLLRDLSVNLDDGHVLLLVTSRTESDDAIHLLPDNTTIVELRRLAVDDVVRYLDHWLGTAPDLEKVKQHVLRQCEGVPLYLEESLRSLEADNIIAGDPGDYRLLDATRPIRLANSIRGLIESRIGKLAEPERRTLQHAAAIGPQFHLPILYHLFPGQQEVVRAALDRLVAGGFLKATINLEQDNQDFRHGLFQEVSYAMLAQDQRRMLHARILSVLRNKISRSLPGRIGLMALHAQQAEDWPAAYVWARAAGRQAEKRCENATAAEQYAGARNALAQLRPSRRNAQRRVDLLTAEPLALLPQGISGAEELLEEAREGALVVGDRRRHATASSILGAYLWVYGDLDEAIKLEREALAAVETQAGTAAEIPVLVRLGGMLTDKGNCAAAVHYMQRSLALCGKAPGDGRHGMAALADVASACFVSPSVTELLGSSQGRACAQTALDRARADGHLFSELMARHFLGCACLADSDVEAASEHLQAAMTLSESIRCRVFRPLTLGGLGVCSLRTGDAKTASALLGAAAADAELLNFKRQIPPLMIWSSQAQLALQHPKQALADALAGINHALKQKQDGDLARAQAAAAVAYATLGDHESAEQMKKSSLSLCISKGFNHTKQQIYNI